jgi:hypothetical protein
MTRLKGYARKLLDGRCIHDLVEHSDYAWQQLLEKAPGVSMNAA